jgi:polysaccharide biosynthesis protein PslE
MSATIGLPSSIVIRDLMLNMWFRRWRILLIMSIALFLAGYVALQIEPKYQSKSMLLVLLGPEYGVRPIAGEQVPNSFNVDPEQLLRTEADILNSDDLHRTVIQQIGLARLYPDLLKPPGPVSKFITQAHLYANEFLGRTEQPHASAQTELLLRAEKMFEQNFGVTPDQKSHIIQLSFQHPNPEVAAETLKALESRYLEFRERLFAERQAAIVQAQQRQTGDQLAAADARLADFKRAHDVGNFAERQRILMAEQGALEDELSKSDSATAGLQARLDSLTAQLRLASGQPNAKGVPNAANALQGMVGAYQKRQQDALTTYRGSPAYDTARTDMMKAQEAIATMRSQQAFQIQQEYDKTAADLHASQATVDAIKPQLQKTASELASINADESQLHELERSRAVLEDSYRAIAKVATDRELIENVSAKEQPSIRVVEAPRVPDVAEPIRMEIMLIGAIVGLIVSIISSLMSGFFYGIYLRPEALEMDTGLAVLAVIPDQRSLASPVVLVTPR